MKTSSNQFLQTPLKTNSEQFQLQQSYSSLHQQNFKNNLTPKRLTHQKIFVQTPQPLFIPLNQRTQQTLIQFQKNISPREDQNKIKKINIFQSHLTQNRNENSQILKTNLSIIQKRQSSTSNVLNSKASIFLKKQRIFEFFYYQNFIVCKGLRKVIVYNLFTKSMAHIPINEDKFILTPFAPYIFNCIIGQYLNLYSENAVQKYMEIQRKRQSQLKKDLKRNNISLNKEVQKQQILAFRQNLQTQKSAQFSAIDVVTIKISKLEVECICKHNQSYFMGGYNRSVLPGGKISERRQVYEMQHLDPKINNKPKTIIKLQPSSFPVSIIQIQMPYLIIYCEPKFYLFGLKSHQLLLTFTKKMDYFLLLEGRYAFNVVNGVGITLKNKKSTIFTFDIESSPIYGVQITEHKQEANCLSLQKTGRIFGSHKSTLFQYIPNKRITRCVKMYPQGEQIIWIQSTPSNNLLVLRQTQKAQYVIEAFTIDQNTITDF